MRLPNAVTAAVTRVRWRTLQVNLSRTVVVQNSSAPDCPQHLEDTLKKLLLQGRTCVIASVRHRRISLDVSVIGSFDVLNANHPESQTRGKE